MEQPYIPMEYGIMLERYYRSIKRKRRRHMWDHGDSDDSKCLLCQKMRWSKTITFPCPGRDLQGWEFGLDFEDQGSLPLSRNP